VFRAQANAQVVPVFDYTGHHEGIPVKDATGGTSILYRGQLHAPAALSPIPTAQWAGWAPEPASTLEGKNALIYSASGPTCWPATISTELSRTQKFGTCGIEHNCLGLS